MKYSTVIESVTVCCPMLMGVDGAAAALGPAANEPNFFVGRRSNTIYRRCSNVDQTTIHCTISQPHGAAHLRIAHV